MAAPPPTYEAASSFPNQGGAPPYPISGQQPPYPMQGMNMAPAFGGVPMPVNPGAGAPMMPPPVMPMRIMGDANIIYNDPNEPKNEDSVGLTSGNSWARSSFSDKAIRRAFIRKVYIILTVQLSVTVAFVAFFLFHEPTKRWVQGPGRWFYYVSYVTFLVTYLTLACCSGVRRAFPANFICLSVFTLAFSHMTGTIASFYDTYSVLIAAAITALVCFSITMFAMQTKIDFTMCTGLIFCLSMVLFFFGFACIIVSFTIGYNYILQCVYGAFAALVFSLFLAYDTQMILGGRKHELSEEEHIFAALQLYLDVVYLFLIILSFFGGKN